MRSSPSDFVLAYIRSVGSASSGALAQAFPVHPTADSVLPVLPVLPALLQVIQTIPIADIESMASRYSQPRCLSPVIVAYLKYLRIYSSFTNPLTLFEPFLKVYDAVFAILQNDEPFSILPLWRLVCKNLVSLALEIDEYWRARNQASTKTSDVQAKLNASIRNLAPDRAETAEARAGLLVAVNSAYSLYFQMDELTLAEKMQNLLLNFNIDFRSFSRPQELLMYHYYTGKYALLKHDCLKAARQLSEAYSCCPSSAPRSKRRILISLIIAKLCLGVFPTTALLAHFGLVEVFDGLIGSVLQNNYMGFLEHLEMQREFLIRHEAYSLLKFRLTTVIYRNVIRKTSLLVDSFPVLHLSSVLVAFELAGFSDFTIDDMESLCVGLIDQGFIRGYMIHNPQRIALSKTNPFPPISSVMNA
ncbi:uncharacterized protein BJ171DRAFT_490938 [Polychytrium aggregatum]|uniref:uncharacterized protein n=1 Tax=Polychytrium aggregatum TaxID=110093 RepID=UPI0022FDF674|nr:uncharacterized protein BJ171DRAFT_490938 [Polychytrium aggregatum]KAI9208314.1 hypothetical protein BJ171DRAFT_490938 [Polychytrium aggregatum]